MSEWIYIVLLKILVPVRSALAAYGDQPPTDNTGGASIKLPDPLGCGDLNCIAGAITKALFDIATPIVAIMVLIGGFQILTAGGDPEKFKKGKSTILYSVVGYAVIIVANGVVSIIQSLLKS